jgi:hypothetical protein
MYEHPYEFEYLNWVTESRLLTAALIIVYCDFIVIGICRTLDWIMLDVYPGAADIRDYEHQGKVLCSRDLFKSLWDLEVTYTSHSVATAVYFFVILQSRF